MFSEIILKFCQFQPHPTSEDVLVVRENEYCQSERMTIFVGVIYAYKGLLMVISVFLVLSTMLIVNLRTCYKLTDLWSVFGLGDASCLNTST